MDSTYLDSLNDQQREAVVYNDGPSLVIAGAGSGKTRVLTYKIVDLLAHGYQPGRILALTFTNKAAREMKDRIAKVAGEDVARQLWMGTFHSIFLRLLRRHADLIGFKSNFTIYDTSDSRSLIKMIIKDMELDEKKYKPAQVLNIISNAKNDMMGPEAYMDDKHRQKVDERSGRPMMPHIYETYCRRCQLADAMDFDDILFYTNKLLRDREDVRLHYQNFFQYILVDEYQDTNFAQHLIINQLAARNKKLFVVGDDAQSIYSFRGANIGNILNLEHNYPELRTFKLERNYRSTQNIVNTAGSLIRHNTRQLEKHVYSEKQEGNKVQVVKAYSDMEEAYLIAAMISNSRSRMHDSLEDYAILYRTNAQSRQLEEALRKRNIPYRIYGGLSFFQRKEVKDALCYFRLAVNPADDEALRRVINFPARKIGETTVMKAFNSASHNGLPIWTILNNPGEFGLNYRTNTLNAIAGFVNLIKDFNAEVEKGTDAMELAQIIYNRSGMLLQYQHQDTPEDVSRLENLKELLKAVHEYTTEHNERGEKADMQGFLSQVALATDQDQDDEENGDKVTMMTLHSAKGLEYKHIYIVGMEEELFPSQLAETPEEIEEERRLLYVGITRAMETCTLTYASSRFRNGQTAATRASRFLRELNPKFLDLRQAGFADDEKNDSISGFTAPYNPFSRFRPLSTKKSGAKTTNRPSFSSSISSSHTPSSSRTPVVPPRNISSDGMEIHEADELEVGIKILHSKFGEGKITSVSTEGNDYITVDFGPIGEKKLMLRFARFKIL